MAYTIQINEAQRAIILAALHASIGDDHAATHDGTPEDEPRVLRELFDLLPHDEAEMIHVHGCTPGQAVHGFAL